MSHSKINRFPNATRPLKYPERRCLFLWHLIITERKHKFILGAYQKDLIYISSLVARRINEGRTLVWLLFIKCTRGESCAHKIVSADNITVFLPPRRSRAVPSKGVQHETYFPVPWSRIYITGSGRNNKVFRGTVIRLVRIKISVGMRNLNCYSLLGVVLILFSTLTKIHFLVICQYLNVSFPFAYKAVN